MFVLVRKSTKAIEGNWTAAPLRVSHPDKPLGVLCFCPAIGWEDANFIFVETTDVKPPLGANEKYVGPTFVVGDAPNFATTATWTVEALPLPPTNQELADQLALQDKVFKAFALVVLDEINALRTAASLPVRTVQQLKNAVATKMSTL